MTTIPTLNRQWLKLQERNRLHWRSTRRWKRSYVPESHEKLLLFDMLLTYIIYATNNTVLWSPQYNEGERTKLWSPACMSNSRCPLHITSHTVPILTHSLSLKFPYSPQEDLGIEPIPAIGMWKLNCIVRNQKLTALLNGTWLETTMPFLPYWVCARHIHSRFSFFFPLLSVEHC